MGQTFHTKVHAAGHNDYRTAKTDACPGNTNMYPPETITGASPEPGVTFRKPQTPNPLNVWTANWYGRTRIRIRHHGEHAHAPLTRQGSNLRHTD